MSLTDLNRLLKKKGILLTFLILFSFFFSEKAVSAKQWNRDYIDIYQNADTIHIRIRFIDYEFGTWGEHAYLEWCDFEFSTDGLIFQLLMRYNGEDQQSSDYSWVCFTNKLTGAKLQLATNYYPPFNPIKWSERKNLRVKIVNPFKNIGIAQMLWKVPSNIKIKYILVTGLWHVDGLNCSYEIDGEFYPIVSVINKMYLNTDVLDKPETNTVNVYSAGNAVVVKGAALGESILVYSTSGTLVKSMVVDQDVVNVKLPANQMYIVKVGQARSKVAL